MEVPIPLDTFHSLARQSFGAASSSQLPKKRSREEEAIEGRRSTGGVSSSAGANASGGDGIASSSRGGGLASGHPKPRRPSLVTHTKPLTNEDLLPVLETLGKEWMFLSRLVDPTNTFEDPDVPCAVCDDHLDDGENEILFCDGCDVAVHQECYGVLRIPSGKWYCKKCEAEQDRDEDDPVACVFCHRSSGALKATTNDDEFAHVLCSSYIPGVSFGSISLMEPVKGVTKAIKERKHMRCIICREKGGAPIQCAEKKCCKAFHVMCAREQGLLESMAQEGPTLLPDFERGAMPRGWCGTHRPRILVDNYAQKLRRAEDNATGQSEFAKTKISSNAATAAQKLADLCNSTLGHLGLPSAPTCSQSSRAATSSKTSITQASNRSSSADPAFDDSVSPPPKRIKSSHVHPADQITDLKDQLQASCAKFHELKEDVKRLRAELAAEKKKSTSDALDAAKLKERFQRARRATQAEIVEKDAELVRLRAQIAGTGAEELSPIASGSTALTSQEPPKAEQAGPSLGEQIKSAIKARDKEYRRPMAALKHYQRTEKYYIKQREETDSWFKDRIKAETELATQTASFEAQSLKMTVELQTLLASKEAIEDEFSTLLPPFSTAYWSLRLPGSDQEKVEKVLGLLGRMEPLKRRMKASEASASRANTSEPNQRKEGEDGGRGDEAFGSGSALMVDGEERV